MVRKSTATVTAGAGGSREMSLSDFCSYLNGLISTDATRDVWVTGELSDFSVRGGHCYTDLIEKDGQGKPTARVSVRIWRYVYDRLSLKFQTATGQALATGLKVRLCVSPTLHPIYGFAVVASDIDPSFTMGDLLRRRQEILDRLAKEGILDLNRQLAWADVPWRIAVISAPQAAGYGDFINQLLTNPSRIRFDVQLYPAVMQGAGAHDSILAALDGIAADAGRYDGVVIIRGGGATIDLQCFEDYDIAAAIAQFPLPVMVGIGHERDITVLDYVANRRVKTPTAAAEWFIKRGESLVNRLNSIGSGILQRATDIMAGAKEQLSYFEGIVSAYPRNAVSRADNRIKDAASQLSGIATRRIMPALERINLTAASLPAVAAAALARQNELIAAHERLLSALSPQAVLARGYSITRCGGKIITSASEATPGDTLATTLADGTVTSTVTKN